MYLFLLTVAAVGIALHLTLGRRERTTRRVTEVILVWMLAVLVGAGGIIAFVAHAFFPAETAAYIGWPAGSPFQFEVAVANLSYGVLGILSIWLRGHFWTATIAAQTVFLAGCAAGHLRQYLLTRNAAPGNMGPAFLFDVALPLLLVALLLVHRRTAHQA